MKKILVPIDFSEHSEYALKAAADIAKRSSGELILVHMLGLTDALISRKESTDGIDTVFFFKLAEKRLAEFLDKDYLEGVSVSSVVKRSTVFKELNDVAQSMDADLIVMGSHGSTGFSEMFVGSNTEKVVRSSDVPVLVIKNNEAIEAGAAVLATDFGPEAVSAFDRFVPLLKAMGYEVKVVYVNLPGAQFKSSAQIEDQMVSFLSKLDDSSGVKVDDIRIQNDFSVEKGIFNYANMTKAKLIAVPTHGRKGLSHFFSGSIGEDIANHANLPVLTMKI